MRVERNGRWLATQVHKADELVIRAFALIHDSRRSEEGYCPFHGGEASAFVLSLRDTLGSGWLLDHRQTTLLRRACAGHTAAHPEDLERFEIDPTILSCWDADRLDFGRVGYAPEPEYLFSEAGRDLARDERIYNLDAQIIEVTALEYLRPTVRPRA